MIRAQPPLKYLTGVLIQPARHHRSRVHIQPDARTIIPHWGLPTSCGSTGQDHPVGNPRSHVSGGPSPPYRLVACGLLFFQDPLLNYLNTWSTYNSWMFNRGSWVQHIPGWVSYGEPGRMMAEPLLMN